ncbi:membrane protein [Bacteroidia bacterium]|nr:membrane protein [Bacteroidia bacterium]
MASFLLALIFILSSCTDWLNLAPEDGVVRNKFWKTKEEVNSAVMGCYASLMEDNMMERYFLWGEMRADMVMPSARANSDILALQNGEIVSTNGYTVWSYFYKTINQCNTVLELAPLAREKDMSFSETLLKQYEAEVTCIRSLAYFYLIRTFRDVPYVTDASLYDNQNFSVPKTGQAEIVDALIVSLREAEKSIPFSYSDVASNKGRFNAWSLKALLADIYLWKSDYAPCVELCTQIINSGQYSLVPVAREAVVVDGAVPGTTQTVYYAGEQDVSLMFQKIYAVGNSVESIFELQFGTDKENPFVRMFAPNYATIQPKTANFVEYFPSSSVDRGWSDIRGEGVSYVSNYIWKWIGLTSTAPFQSRPDGSSFSNWIFYRLADVLLMKAEALTQLAKQNGNNQTLLLEAKDLLTQVRDRANAPESTDLLYGQKGDLEAKTLEEFILNERTREFTFEGKHWFDVLRHAKRDNYAPENLAYLLRLAILSAPPEKTMSLQSKWQGNKGSHYLPINANEIKVNKALVQNEFYN